MDTILYALNDNHGAYLKKNVHKYSNNIRYSFGRKIGGAPLPEYITAQVIHPDLALFKMEHNSEDTPEWRIIHIPTGWVLAQGEYFIVSNVKNTYPKFKWIWDADTGRFMIIDAPFTWQIDCKLRYERYIENGPQT